MRSGMASLSTTSQREALVRGNGTALLVGGQIDYNYQAGIIVMGGEAMSGAFSGNSGTWPGNIGGRFPVDIGGELDDHRGWPHRYLLSDFAIRSG
jgi:hypothetical protein